MESKMKSNLFSIADEKGNIYWGKLVAFIFAFLIAVTIVSIGARYIATGAGWATLPAEKYSKENMEKEYEWYYKQHEGIRANRATISSLEKKKQSLFTLHGQDTSKWPFQAKDEFSQTSTQILQLQSAVNSACGAYTARWDNFFHNIAAPPNIPRTCEMIQ